MARFPTPAHLASWAGRTPAGRPVRQAHRPRPAQERQQVPRRRHRRDRRIRGKTATREGARYRRLARRRGKAKAQVALGNTQLKVYHKLLSSPGMRYQDLGPDYYEQQAAIRRKIAYHVREIEALGLDVTLCRRPEPELDRPASTQTA